MTEEEEKLVERYHRTQRRKYIILTVLGVVVGAVIGNLIGSIIFWVVG